MFLFTTPAPRTAAPATPVVDAIRSGAERTGTDFDYLLATAKKESALNPEARAPTSSATGLFQFIEQTWLGLVKSDGPKLGLGRYSGAITTRADGTHGVEDPALRQEILSLREDPKVSALMAGAFTQKNRDMLASEIGREPNAGDLYVAHFLGARGAAELIRVAQAAPQRPAASDFPDAAAANRSIFYDRSGRARGAGEVYALLAANRGGTGEGTAAPAFAPDKPLAFAKSDGPAFHGFFQTGGDRGAISDAVSRLWRVGGSDQPARTAALGSYFPRGDGGAGDVKPAAETAAEAPRLVDAPLPPPRPASLGSGQPVPGQKPGAAPRPLDLSAFMAGRRP